ncbi:MAG: hypothetical protein AAF996_03800 [Pseudomonadota bacterium]
MKVQKTVSDIWHEVREEQRRFNKIVRYLVGALIVAFILAGIAAIQSWLKFNDLSGSYQVQIDRTIAQEAIMRTDANRERQNMKLELLELRETISQQREYADIPRQVDRALSSRSNRSEIESIEEVVAMAVEEAENSALGKPLNTSTAYLLDAVLQQLLDDSDEDLQGLVGPDERQLLKAAQKTWIDSSSDEVGDIWFDFSQQATSDRMKGVALAGLGLYYYDVSQGAELGLSWDGGCSEAVRLIEEASSLQVNSSTLALRKGECLRKNGDKLRAFKEFFSALQQQSPDDPIHERRLAAHGAGTTLIALEVASESDELIARQIEGFTQQLEALPLIANAELAAEQLSEQSPRILEQALVLLEHAADLRELRGEGKIGEIYTRENIGFIYVRQKNWDTAIKHAREIDQDMALGWNLTVLIIALEEQANRLQEEGQRSVARRLQDEARKAREKIALLEPGRLDREEIEKLLGDAYTGEVETIYRSMQNNQMVGGN